MFARTPPPCPKEAIKLEKINLSAKCTARMESLRFYYLSAGTENYYAHHSSDGLTKFKLISHQKEKDEADE